MEEQVSGARIAVKYGVLTSVVLMVYTTIVNVAGQSQNKGLAFIAFVLFLVVGIILAMNGFRAENKGYMSYGDGLSTGSLVSAIIGVLGSAFNLAYNKFIDPSLMARNLEQIRSDMQSRGLDSTQLESAMDVYQKMMAPPVLFIAGVVFNLLAGFLISLIIAAIVRNDRPVFD